MNSNIDELKKKKRDILKVSSTVEIGSEKKKGWLEDFSKKQKNRIQEYAKNVEKKKAKEYFDCELQFWKNRIEEDKENGMNFHPISSKEELATRKFQMEDTPNGFTSMYPNGIPFHYSFFP